MSSLEPQIGSQNEDPELYDLEQQLLLICNEDDPTPSTSRTFDFLAEEQPEEHSPDRGKLNKILSDNRAEGVGHDSDSSDDEEIRNFLERKYNEYGRDIHMSMKRREEEKKNRVVELEVERNMQGCDKLKLTPQLPALGRVSRVPETPGEAPKLNLPGVPKLQRIKEEIAAKKDVSVYTDPVFGMRLVKPLVSGKFLEERMKDKVSVSMSRIRNVVDNLDKSLDWVFAGVIVSKSPVKTSQNGAQYSVWTLTDLKNDIKTCTLLLFKSAHKDLWKTPQGTVVAVLNPNVMERRNDKTEANLSINTAEKVMILGQSKDLGTCRSRKKNGDPCTSIVNLSVCDHCVFHMKREFTNLSRRSELQSATAGRGLNELRNKVLGKNEVFYGGQSFTAIPAKKNAKQVAKDNQRLLSLSEYFGRTASSSSAGNPGQARQEKVRRAEAVAEVNVAQRQKDLERLRILRAESSCGSGPGSVRNPGSVNPGQKTCREGEVAQKLKNPDQGKLLKAEISSSGSSLNPQRPVLRNPCAIPGQKLQEITGRASNLGELTSAQKPKNPDQGKLPKAESSPSGSSLNPLRPVLRNPCASPGQKLQEKPGRATALGELNSAQKLKNPDQGNLLRAESPSSGSSLNPLRPVLTNPCASPGQKLQKKPGRPTALGELNSAQKPKNPDQGKLPKAESSTSGSSLNPLRPVLRNPCASPGQKLQEKPGRATALGELNSAQKLKNPDQGNLLRAESPSSGSSLNPQRPVLTNPCDNPGQKIQEKPGRAATLGEWNSAQKLKNPDQGKLLRAESSISGNTLASQPSTSGISSVSPGPKLQEKSGKATVLTEKNLAQKPKNLDRLSVSGAESSSSGSSPTQSTSTSSGNPPETSSGKPQMAIFSSMIPTLSRSSFVVDVESKATLRARAKAAEILKKTPLQKSNPNFIKYRGTESGKKRVLEEMNQELPSAKRHKIEEQAKKDRIQKIMAATTSHMDLVDRREMQETQKYLNTLEKKEALEEKMLSTYKVACKAVACKKCKYLAFSAAPRCLEERHPLKVIDTEKRFFKCGDCGNRTATVHRIPKFSCKNCSSSRWEPTGMIRERIVESTGDKLSIRGDEEKYLGTTTAGNINLLVPDDQ
ncbi:protein MCM10 homolog [Phlebotomus papatasi]|uniref:protein MCM10 homolog n=1 Tax=Phlebotomus papatasi TaxID=29031 RepID=UPI002483F98B|nr:protein MCM10 homolog [Phlebotomus papatasi]